MPYIKYNTVLQESMFSKADYNRIFSPLSFFTDKQFCYYRTDVIYYRWVLAVCQLFFLISHPYRKECPLPWEPASSLMSAPR